MEPPLHARSPALTLRVARPDDTDALLRFVAAAGGPAITPRNPDALGAAIDHGASILVLDGDRLVACACSYVFPAAGVVELGTTIVQVPRLFGVLHLAHLERAVTTGLVPVSGITDPRRRAVAETFGWTPWRVGPRVRMALEREWLATTPRTAVPLGLRWLAWQPARPDRQVHDRLEKATARLRAEGCDLVVEA